MKYEKIATKKIMEIVKKSKKLEKILDEQEAFFNKFKKLIEKNRKE